MIRFLSLIAIIVTFAASASAQEAAGDSRASTGGAQTLADILERQEGLKVDETFRSEATVILMRQLPSPISWARLAVHLTLNFGALTALALQIFPPKAVAQRQRL